MILMNGFPIILYKIVSHIGHVNTTLEVFYSIISRLSN